MEYIIGAVCFIVGFIFSMFFFGAKKLNGTLYIMQDDDEDRDIYRFEIDDLDELSKHKKIRLKVETVDFNS